KASPPTFLLTSFSIKMTRKRLPIFQKVSNLLKISIFIPKLRKQSIPKLLLFKKSRKLKNFKLLEHYNYGFLGEYQFSPASTPLIHYQRKQFKTGSFRDLYSLFCLCRCSGNFQGEVASWEYQLETLPLPLPLPLPAIANGIAGEFFEEFDSEDEEEESVDQKAERIY
ncbi:Cotton fiber protein, partial [Quillaja saponaria]